MKIIAVFNACGRWTAENKEGRGVVFLTKNDMLIFDEHGKVTYEFKTLLEEELEEVWERAAAVEQQLKKALARLAPPRIVIRRRTAS